jgi:hypothetical protein
MSVCLNITIDEDVHQRLKNELPAKGISRFINDAVRARLRPGCCSVKALRKTVRLSARSLRRVSRSVKVCASNGLTGDRSGSTPVQSMWPNA